jgi:hypothetical protein
LRRSLLAAALKALALASCAWASCESALAAEPAADAAEQLLDDEAERLLDDEIARPDPNHLADMRIGRRGQSDAPSRRQLDVLAAQRLFALPLDQGLLQPASNVPSPGFAVANVRLTGGGSLLYAAYDAGFNVFSLADPLIPVLVQQHTTAQRGWKQMVPNGSGLGVAVVGITPPPTAPHDVYLYDLNPGGTNGVFLTLLTTPGLAGALSIYNGLAYVADGANGLLVLNYTEADTKKVPPRIDLSASFPLGTNSQAPSASPVRVRANVSDDVQVRNVEFYVDGVKVATDGNFPFFCNTGMVEISAVLEHEDQAFLREYLQKHFDYTGSTIAETVLQNWHAYLPKFMRVMPLEYKRVLQERKLAEIDAQLAYIVKTAELEKRY